MTFALQWTRLRLWTHDMETLSALVHFRPTGPCLCLWQVLIELQPFVEPFLQWFQQQQAAMHHPSRSWTVAWGHVRWCQTSQHWHCPSVQQPILELQYKQLHSTFYSWREKFIPARQNYCVGHKGFLGVICYVAEKIHFLSKTFVLSMKCRI